MTLPRRGTERQENVWDTFLAIGPDGMLALKANFSL